MKKIKDNLSNFHRVCPYIDFACTRNMSLEVVLDTKEGRRELSLLGIIKIRKFELAVFRIFLVVFVYLYVFEYSFTSILSLEDFQLRKASKIDITVSLGDIQYSSEIFRIIYDDLIGINCTDINNPSSAFT